jgi:AcrR family transcriptional regulator
MDPKSKQDDDLEAVGSVSDPAERATRAEKKAQSRKRILEAARDVFFRDGFMAANLDEVAEKAGVAKGTLYNYADSKEGLFLQAVEYAAGQVIAHLKAQISPQAAADERLRQFVLADLDFMDRHQDEYMLMVAVFYGANFLYGRGTSYLSVAVGAYREFFAMLEDMLAGWMGPKQLERRGGQVVAFQVLALIEAANLASWTNPGEPVDRKRDADRILAMLGEGLGPVAS